MEIRDWIRAIGARLALIAVVAGVAAALAAGLALFQPQQYRATATIVLPDIPVAGPLTAAVAQRVANFEAAVTSDGALDAVAGETGAPRSSLDAVTAVSGGTGNVIEVRFVGREPDLTREVAVEASRQGLLLQAEADAALAAGDEAAARTAWEAAVREFDDRVEELGYAYAAPDLTLRELGNDLQAALRQDDFDEIDELNQKIAIAQGVQRLRDVMDASFTAYSLSLDRLTQAQGRLTAVRDTVPPVGDVVPLSKLRAIISQALYAGLFGAALAVGFVIIVELLRTGTPSRPSLPRPSRQRSSAGAF